MTVVAPTLHLHPDLVKLTRSGGAKLYELTGVALVRADSLADAQRTLDALCEIVAERGLPPFSVNVEFVRAFDDAGDPVPV